MAWTILIVAGLLEIGWAAGLKQTHGFTRLLPTFLTLASMASSLALLGLAMRSIPLGTAYAAWTGIGILGTSILGMALHGEPASLGRLLCVLAILGGIAGLKLFGSSA